MILPLKRFYNDLLVRIPLTCQKTHIEKIPRVCVIVLVILRLLRFQDLQCLH